MVARESLDVDNLCISQCTSSNVYHSLVSEPSLQSNIHRSIIKSFWASKDDVTRNSFMDGHKTSSPNAGTDFLARLSCRGNFASSNDNIRLCFREMAPCYLLQNLPSAHSRSSWQEQRLSCARQPDAHGVLLSEPQRLSSVDSSCAQEGVNTLCYCLRL